MFKEIFIYELKLWLKRPGIYIYFGIFFALAFLLGAAISGMFGGVSTDTNTHINSANEIADILTSFSSDYLFGLINILICVALMAGSVQRDFQYNCFSFYFTKPISQIFLPHWQVQRLFSFNHIRFVRDHFGNIIRFSSGFK